MTPNAGGDDGGGGGMKKGPWSAAEDAILTEYVKKNGEGNWNAVQRNTVLWRCGKSCRLRWANHLRPNLKKGAFSVEEERMIIELHSKLGNKWARISAHLPGRTDNEIKNYWNTRMKRRLRHGLPLYPHDLHHFPLSPPPAPPLPCRKNPPENPLCIFNPISLSYPTPLFSLHPPPILSSPPYPKSKRISHLGQPQLPSINSFQLNPVSFSLSSVPILETEMGFGLELDRDGGGSGFRSDSELPSNQFYQKDATSEDMEDVLVKDNPNVNVGRSNSGLLDALLQEAQDKVRAKGSKRERDDFGTQWDEQSSSENSFGLKKEEREEYHSNAMNEDLSSLLDLIPSLVHVPEWCNDGREPSIGQSSVVTDDNYVPEPQPPCFPEEDWNSGCCNWDNLPRIC